ncbi:DUF551 domain-containing protein [Acinetobacter pittii]|uniref:hypothetical protein n=1 Tax=Acinetobacter pittii TaxID=48296 RepID=UPI00355C89D6
MICNDRSFFEENFKKTETFKHESSIRDSDILVFSETMNGYFNIVVNEAWMHWNKEMQAHADWYKNDDPISYEWAKGGSPEYEADFYASARAWAAAKNQAGPTWIRLDEKEPPPDTMVLICWSDSPDVQPEVDYMTCDEDLNHIWANFERDPPTHWMYFHKVPNESKF